MNPGNICVVMAYTGNPTFIEMGDFSSKVNGDYCRRHGYRFRVYRNYFDPTRHPSWSKIFFVRNTLNDYEWVFWIDADAIITNPDIKLEKFLDDHYMLIMAKQDWNKGLWNTINFGVFLARKDPLLTKFFDLVWGDIKRKGRVGWEQDGVRLYMNKEPYKSKAKVVCRREFNSLIPHESLKMGNKFNLETEAWHKGDFIAHYGCKRTDILAAMKETLSCR